MSNLVQNPFPIFTDSNGDPLEDGYVFIGEPGLSPITNPLQAYWDAALTIPANDIRTKGGYPHNSGTPGRLYTSTNYSILVKDKRGAVVYTQLNSIDYLEAPLTEAILKVDTITDLREIIPVNANTQVSVGGSVTVGDGLVGPFFYWDPFSSAVDNGVSVVQPTDATGFGRWLWISNAYVPVDQVDIVASGTLELDSINKVFLVDTATPIVLAVPDGDFQGQQVTLSNDGISTLEITGTGIAASTFVTGGVILTWIGTGWNIALVTSGGDLDVPGDLVVGGNIDVVGSVAVDTVSEKTTNAGIGFVNTVKWKYYYSAVSPTQGDLYTALDTWVPNVDDYMSVTGQSSGAIGFAYGIKRSSATNIFVYHLSYLGSATISTVTGISGSATVLPFTVELMSNFDAVS